MTVIQRFIMTFCPWLLVRDPSRTTLKDIATPYLSPAKVSQALSYSSNQLKYTQFNWQNGCRGSKYSLKPGNLRLWKYITWLLGSPQQSNAFFQQIRFIPRKSLSMLEMAVCTWLPHSIRVSYNTDKLLDWFLRFCNWVSIVQKNWACTSAPLIRIA